MRARPLPLVVDDDNVSLTLAGPKRCAGQNQVWPADGVAPSEFGEAAVERIRHSANHNTAHAPDVRLATPKAGSELRFHARLRVRACIGTHHSERGFENDYDTSGQPVTPGRPLERRARAALLALRGRP